MGQCSYHLLLKIIMIRAQHTTCSQKGLSETDLNSHYTVTLYQRSWISDDGKRKIVTLVATSVPHLRLVTAAVWWIKLQLLQQAWRPLRTAVQLVQQADSQATSQHNSTLQEGKHGNAGRLEVLHMAPCLPE